MVTAYRAATASVASATIAHGAVRRLVEFVSSKAASTAVAATLFQVDPHPGVSLVPQSPVGNNPDTDARDQRGADRLEGRRPLARKPLSDDAQDPALHDRDPLLRRRELVGDGSPPLELLERFAARSEEPFFDEDRLRPLDELAALASPDFEPLRRARLPPPEDALFSEEDALFFTEEDALFSEDLTSASSIVPRHSPDSCSIIMMYAL
jgi:hypothetical protein